MQALVPQTGTPQTLPASRMDTSNSPDALQVIDTEPSGAVGARRWFIVGLLSIGASIAYFDRTNISAALAYRPFVEHFHLSDIDRGMLNSAFFWSYMVLQIPTGWLVDRYGVKIPYAVSFVIWCLSSALTGLTRSVSELATLRVLTGAGEAIVTPASFRWMRQHFPEQQSGLAVGIYMLGTKIGPALGAPLAAWLITLYDWHLMFVIIGLTGLVWLIPWLLLVKDDRPQDRRRDPARPRATVTLPFRNIMASPVVWGTVIVNFCYNYFVFYCMTWMPAYFVERRHVSLTRMGLFSFFSFAGIGIVALLAGWVADLIIRRGGNPVVVRKAFVIAGFAIACTELIGVRSASVQGALFWAVVSLSGLGLTTANNLALCRMTLIPPQGVGLVTGVQNVSTSLAGIVGPILSGWLLQTTGGYEAPMLAIFFFLVLGGLTCLVLLRPEWSPKLSAVG
jgi:MFS transporter, ACS family, D-galactonate transporter